MVKTNLVSSHSRNSTFINRKKPERKHVHDPGLKTIKMVENELREKGFFTSKNSLWRSLPKQTQYPTFCKALDYLEESNKIAYDKDGNIIWIFVESKEAQKLLDDSIVLNLPEKAQKPVRYRSKTDIVASILQSANNPKGVAITTIMYKSFLSHSQLKEYLPILLEKHLIKLEDEHLYKSTEKGLRFLQLSSNVNAKKNSVLKLSQLV